MSKDMLVIAVMRESDTETEDKISNEKKKVMDIKHQKDSDDGQEQLKNTDTNISCTINSENDNNAQTNNNILSNQKIEITVAIGSEMNEADIGEGSDNEDLKEKKEIYDKIYNYNLAKANRIYSLIDLSMAIVAPILIGLICDKNWFMESSKSESDMLKLTMWASIFVGAWNILSCIPEILIPGNVAKRYNVKEFYQPQIKPSNKLTLKRFSAQGCVRLMHQKATVAIISFSLIYCTILTPNSSPLISYLVGSRDFSSLYISIFAACAQILGMLGLQLAPSLVKKEWFIPSIAELGVFLQCICIIIALIVFSIDYEAKKEYMVYIELSAIALSRFGLWLFDNTFNLILQKTVNSSEVSVINGSVAGLNAVFQAIALLISIFTPVSYFIVLVGVSAGIVITSTIIYTAYWLHSKKITKKGLSCITTPEEDIELKTKNDTNNV